MFPDAVSERRARSNAKRLRDLNSSKMREAEDAAFEKVGFAAEAIQEHMGKRAVPGTGGVEQAQTLVREYGGKGSEGHRALRQAVWLDVFEGGGKPAIEFHKDTNNLVLNPSVLRDKIAELKKSGMWLGLLTERDRKVLEGAHKYAQRTYRKGDAGTGLTVAAQIGQARSFDPRAFATIYTSKKMAELITRDSLDPNHLFLRVGRSAKGASGKVGSWLGDERVSRTLGAIARSYGQGTAGEAFRKDSLSQPMPPQGEAGLPPRLGSTPPGL
jgi:hypothetical protein